MPVTQVSIANSALIKVGADTISSITQSDRRATLIYNLWDHVRDEVLSAHPWNFSIKRASLAPTATVPEFEYDFSYDIPNDCLRILDEESPDTEFVIEGSNILSSEATLNIRYIFRNVDESSWSPTFAEAMAWRLARELAASLTQSTALMQICDQQFEATLAKARSVDGAEGVNRELVIDDWTLSRR